MLTWFGIDHPLFGCSCREDDKDGYLYYILSVHGQGRTIVFCTSIAALRHISSLLRILGVNVWTLHAQMQQRARLKVSFMISSPYSLISNFLVILSWRKGGDVQASLDGH